MKTTKIVIVGGGFAGLSAAMHLHKTLARRADIEVTLISRENFILFTPMLSPGNLGCWRFSGSTGRRPKDSWLAQHGLRQGRQDRHISSAHRANKKTDRWPP
jgi:glycine/D-amino acid oxidase-like deaminating enzyme